MTEDFVIRALGEVLSTERRRVRGLEEYPLWIDFHPPLADDLEIKVSDSADIRWLNRTIKGGIISLPNELGALLLKIANNQITRGKMWVQPNPYLLQGTQFEVRPKQVFVVQSWRLRETVLRVIKEILAEENFTAVYSGDRGGQVVFADIWLMLNESEIVIVDFTDKRPNVYLQYGMALVLGKPIVAIAQSTDDLPSDTPNLKAIVYQDRLGDDSLRRALHRAIVDTVADIERARIPPPSSRP